MRTFRLYRHGLTLGTSGTHNRKPGKRGKVSGWSDGAARRNTAFLRSVIEPDLTGVGIALTLTLRHCPPSADDWKRLLAAWIDRQRKAGLIRLHWVMEFQRRGVPHLHVAAWYSPDSIKSVSFSLSSSPSYYDLKRAGDALKAASAAVSDWLHLSARYGSGPKGQQARPIDGAVGWFVYMAKHCSRGRKHYQRQRDAHPDAWSACPRVWGHRGSWPIEEPSTGILSDRQFYRLRRLVRSFNVSKAREAVPSPGWYWLHDMGLFGHFTRDQLRAAPITPVFIGDAGSSLRTRLNRLKAARSMLSHPDPAFCAACGVSEWIPADQHSALLSAASR